MSCKIKIRKKNDIAIVKLSGDLTGQDTAMISKKMESLISKFSKIVIDLSQTTFIDSYGLGVFIYFWKIFSEQDQELVFCNPHPFIQDVFTGTNLNQVFRLIDSIEEL